MDVTLVMFKGDGQRKDFPTPGPEVILGRAEDCDLRVPLLSVSRHHCQITVSDQEVKVRDLGSSNGTYVNNQRISGDVSLMAGDRIVIGPIVFTVQIDGDPEEIQQVKTKGQKMAEEGQAAPAVVGADAEVTAQGAASDAGAPAALAGGQEPPPVDAAQQESADVDPISALEAMASESKKDPDKR